jgi:hypothetical protein
MSLSLDRLRAARVPAGMERRYARMADRGLIGVKGPEILWKRHESGEL